jgi:hypothetical protein
MYCNWEFHDHVTHPRTLEVMSDNGKVDQDIFNHLNLEDDLGQNQFFRPDNIVSRSSSLPDQLLIVLECPDKTAANTSVASAEGRHVPNRESEENESILLSREQSRSFEGVGGRSLAPRQKLFLEPIDLTKLLIRCEDNVELVTEVSAALRPRVHQIGPSPAFLSFPFRFILPVPAGPRRLLHAGPIRLRSAAPRIRGGKRRAHDLPRGAAYFLSVSCPMQNYISISCLSFHYRPNQPTSLSHPPPISCSDVLTCAASPLSIHDPPSLPYPDSIPPHPP